MRGGRYVGGTCLVGACALVLASCSDPPRPTPTVFERPAEAADAVEGPAGASFEDSRLVGTWRGERVYLAITDGGELICIVAVGDGESGSACSDGPPIELNGPSDYRFDLETPDPHDGWQPIAPDVYARS
jgi:hypothetical protein